MIFIYSQSEFSYLYIINWRKLLYSTDTRGWFFKNSVMCITSKQAKLKQSLRLGLLLVILGAKSKALAHNKTTLCLFQDLFC